MSNPMFTRLPFSRRDLFCRAGCGVGSIALASLLAEDLPAGDAEPLAPRVTHLPPRAKNVIFVHLVGGSFTPGPVRPQAGVAATERSADA
ncbi:MAG: hypothetical protein R3B90_09030 [Planctomycetaceae bacterium]